ncbi:sn-glycerol-3-phosphate ABC transporter ATP-binding protein UgpC [Phyllobacterium phragmitis]|uniref:sn-glycerol-3-phosphate ABC transporter ATP-binding protein UgpC n=1 Tax=Phyllobacterium phragmitis TaxID=2670329 RepID=A0A2S9IJG9_9HYPH|nr:sn-glycerol-3-phosphate ABC transporter ATP-binding protein UgpC [Phyllobacterium phragmitis]PRD40655.1 sn-glycerol-3-phosphate ABC transporter ATP-binding protein UgpC [Phyllobacterium phragmitis]
MATVDLKDIRKIYPGGFEAVKKVDLAIKDGALCVLVGPSGCGKSTLLRMIAGLETITEGEILIDGREVNELGPAERDIAMVFQNYALYPHMSVYDNMAYGLRNRRMAKPEIDKRVREAAATLELDHLLTRRPRELSGGQRQRVAMGRAIVRSPKVFLFDEPLSNLDAKLRGQMRVEIKNLQRSLGVTSVYVTHDQLEAMTLADVLVVMNAGNVEQIGAPLDIYEKPATLFVASFIGAPPMNLLPLKRGEGRAALADGTEIGGKGLSLSREAATLGIRPENLVLAAADGADGLDATFDIVVRAIEPVGAESFVYGDAGKTRLVVRVAGKTIVEPGAHMRIGASAADLHIFDEAGKRI